jgi:hypothetical protein
MKTTSLIVALAAGLAAVPCVQASDKDKENNNNKPAAVEKDKAGQVQSPRTEKGVALTGSYIKRDVKRSGTITDGSSQVVVLDRDFIDQSGASDLKQVLIRRGVR